MGVPVCVTGCMCVHVWVYTCAVNGHTEMWVAVCVCMNRHTVNVCGCVQVYVHVCTCGCACMCLREQVHCECVHVCALSWWLCPGTCDLCGVTGELDLVSSPIPTSQPGGTGVGIQEEAACVLGERPGKGPQFGSAALRLCCRCLLHSPGARAPRSCRSFELQGHTSGPTAGGQWSQTHSCFSRGPV